MRDWVPEAELQRLTGLSATDLRHWRRDAKNGAAVRREDRHLVWTYESALTLLAGLKLDPAILSEKGAPAAPSAAQDAARALLEEQVFTVVRSAPHVRNRTVVLAVPGVMKWRDGFEQRDRVVTVKVRDNARIRPGMLLMAVPINEHYWRFLRYEKSTRVK